MRAAKVSRIRATSGPRSEIDLQRQLNDPRVLGTSNRSELTLVEAGRRPQEIRVIEKIECLGAKIEPRWLPNWEGFRNRNIPRLQTRCANVRQEAAGVSEGKWRRVHERSAVKVIIKAVFHAARRAARDSRSVRPLRGIAAIKRAGRVDCVDRDRWVTLDSADTTHAPPAGDRIDDRTFAVEQPTPCAERQLIIETNYQPLW